MVGLAKSCSGGGSLLNYIMNDRKGYELFRNNLCGLNPKEIIEEMNIIQDLNHRAKNRTLSLVLSPSIDDGHKLSNFELKEMTVEFLKELGIDTENHQFLGFVHTEKLHKHIHIYCGRLNMDSGKLVSDHFIGKKAQWAAHRLATKRGLNSAKQIMIDKIRANQNQELKIPKSTKGEIYSKHLKALERQYNSLEEYFQVMKIMGVEVQPSINKQGQVQGFRFVNVATNESFKASEVNRKINLKDIGKPIVKVNQNTIKKFKHGR